MNNQYNLLNYNLKKKDLLVALQVYYIDEYDLTITESIIITTFIKEGFPDNSELGKLLNRKEKDIKYHLFNIFKKMKINRRYRVLGTIPVEFFYLDIKEEKEDFYNLYVINLKWDEIKKIIELGFYEDFHNEDSFLKLQQYSQRYDLRILKQRAEESEIQEEIKKEDIGLRPKRDYSNLFLPVGDEQKIYENASDH